MKKYLEKNKKLNEIEFEYINTRQGVFCDNIVCFDIETTSAFIIDERIKLFDKTKKPEYYSDAQKIGLCYLWTCAIDYNIFQGRELESFLDFLHDLMEIVGARIICYIHNLSFEFAFLQNIFDDLEVFARNKRKPIYFRWEDIEFRCSYMLTRLSLNKWAESKNLSHKKLIGTVDYNVMRTPKTILDKELIDYADADVLVMVDGLQEYKVRFGSMYNIPITQTGIVRREYNKRMHNERKYQFTMRSLVPDTLEDYAEQVEVFGGGLTRGNRLLAGEVLDNVRSRDKTSAYPWAMLSKKYPMTNFVEVPASDFFMGDSNYSYIIEVELWDVKSKFWNTYLSKSKCIIIKDGTFDNGRIISAKYIRLKTINVDYEIIMQSYDIGRQNILSFKYALNGYLHDNLCLYILELFNNKTTLKGLYQYEDLYAKSKEELNALFGCLVTKEITDDVVYIDGEWQTEYLSEATFKEKIEKKKRNLSKLNGAYCHGIFIPAYQRADLWSHVMNGLDIDTVYMDTDSNKHINHELYDDYFDNYNASIREEQERVAARLNIDVERLRPVAPDGKISSIGEYEIDADYDKFITLGAKRYCYEDKKGLHITVSGVSKSAASQLKSIYDFTDGLVFDVDHAKKSILHYNDDQPQVIFNEGQYDEYISRYKHGVCLQPTSYTMSLTKEYGELLNNMVESRTRIFVERENQWRNKITTD